VLGLLAELQHVPVLENGVHPQRRAARMEVDVLVLLRPVVDEPERCVAAGAAEHRVHGGRGVEQELELEVAEKRMFDGGFWEGAARVEVERAVVAPVPPPVAAAGLHAAVAPERRAGGGHQLELVRTVGLVRSPREGPRTFSWLTCFFILVFLISPKDPNPVFIA
jgi:hypothetical protein